LAVGRSERRKKELGELDDKLEEQLRAEEGQK
jgi:hypothetical protein